jgi:hypothetical protein
MNLKRLVVLSTCVAALASTVATVLAINVVSAQDRRQDRRQDRDPNRVNVHCEVNGFGPRSDVRFEGTLDEADRWCRKGDTIVLNSPALVARLCDFSWQMVTTGSGATVCVFGGVRDLR